MCGIYLIRNIITNKVYIGQSINIKQRWSEHKARAFNPNNNCYHKPLYLSMRKYGLEAFVFEVLCECSPEELDDKEKYYINQYDCIVPKGYNILPGGQENNNLIVCKCKQCGKIISNDTKTGLCRECYAKTTRIIERPTAEQLIKELQNVNGNFSELGRQYGVNGNSIRKWCKQYNISYKSADYKVIKENQEETKKPHKLSVNQLDKETGEILATYESACAAARALGKSGGNHITEVCRGINKTAYGYRWEYAALM